MKIVPIILVLPLMIAGCASTNPSAALTDVGKTVANRTGQQMSDASKGAVDVLLQTNLTAQSAVAIALLNNRSLRAEFEEVGISQAELAQTSRLHNIELFGSWRFPDQSPSPADIEYSASADFLDLLTLPTRKKIARQNLEQTKLEVADKVLRLAADTQTVFYDLQSQMELVKRLETIVEANEAAADMAQRQYDAGNINELSLHEQQAPAVQSYLDLMRAKAKMQSQWEQLNRLLGLSEQQINWQIASELPALPANAISLTNLESLAVSQRLDLAAQRRQVESIATALRLKEHTCFIPGATVGVDTERTPDGQRVTGPTLDLELPIFDQGQPAIAKLMAEWRQAKDDYAAQELNVCSEVREAENDLLSAREAAVFSRDNLEPLRQTILKETLLQYNAMQKNSFDLLVAKEQEQEAEQMEITALHDYWIARVKLERAVGGRLPVESVAPVSAKPSSQIMPMPQQH